VGLAWQAYGLGHLAKSVHGYYLVYRNGTTCVSTTASVEGAANFTVIFPTAGDFKVVCLVHENMTGVIHVLDRAKRLPHDQDFYDRQAAVQRRDLLSDTDGERDRNRYRHEDSSAI
jgi:hypothetical protein